MGLDTEYHLGPTVHAEDMLGIGDIYINIKGAFLSKTVICQLMFP